MLKKIILSVLIGFMVIVLGVGYGFVNLKSNSVYYAQRTPHKAGMEPVLMEVTRNLDWIYAPDINGISYDYDGYRNIYNNQNSKQEEEYFAYNFSGEYRTLKYSNDPVDVSAVKRDIYRVVQPVIDAQPEPLINLQWIYDWVNKDRFN